MTSAGRAAPGAPVAAARERIRRWEPWLGAVVTGVDPSPAAGDGPLDGVVVGVKDLVAVAGVPRLCGAPGVVDTSPQPRHATVVERLVGAGAPVVATLALHQLAYGVVTPQTRNPRAPDRVAGGSSGGSAAAVAAGLVRAAVGSDTGGSVRIPAACCGVAGLKTTHGLVPCTGVQPLAWTLDTVGPLAATVADLALLLPVMAGNDPADPYSAPAAAAGVAGRVESPWVPDDVLAGDPTGMRVGVPEQTRSAHVDADVRAVWEQTLDDLRTAGAQVVPVGLPELSDAHTASGRVLAAEAAAVHGHLLERHSEHLWPDVRERLELGRRTGAPVVAAARHHGARLRAALGRVFAHVDVLVIPTLPCRAPPAGADAVTVDSQAEPVVSALTRLTSPWNLAGVPAGSVPAGVDADGAPVGVQVVGPWFAERRVLAAMRAVESLRGGPWSTVPDPPDT